MASRPSSSGFVLPLVTVLLVSLMLLFSLLLKTAGRMNPVLVRHKMDFERFYSAESAVLLHLVGFPSGYYPNLPQVQSERFGPWEKICTVSGEDEKSDRTLCLMAGTELHKVPYGEWANGISGYRSALESQILEGAKDESLYGNRRLFQGARSMAGVVRAGDLEADFSDSVSSACYWVEGTVEIRGQAHFDTLRLYSQGDVLLRGDLSVGYLELFTQGHLRIEDNVRFSGMAVASSFQIRDRVQGIFPAVVIAHGTGIPWGEVVEGAVVDGATEVPGGFLGVEDSTNVKMSILPAFVDGPREIWGRL